MSYVLNALTIMVNGGPGSGNFGHSGRPGKVGGSGKGKGSHTATSPKSKAGRMPLDPYTKSSINPEMTSQSRVGVPGDEIPEKLPRFQNLPSEQAQVQEEFNALWEDKAKREEALKQLDDMEPFKSGTIETDAIKQLDPRWGKDSDLKVLAAKIEEGTATDTEKAQYESMMAFRQKNNTVMHQAANALAKEYFSRKLKANPDAELLVTTGGCASGKGFSLEMASKGELRNTFMGRDKNGKRGKLDSGLENTLNGLMKKAKEGKVFIWDSAGDQNATELNWLASFGRKTTILHTLGDAYNNTRGLGSGLVQRAVSKGRMVDGQVYVESYNIGNRNVNAFYKANKNNPNFQFIKVENRGAAPKDPVTGKRPMRWSYIMEFDAKSSFDGREFNATKVQKDLERSISNLENKQNAENIKFGAEFTN